ncbi:MAG: DUF6438 domain-containing protein [Saprospiraceae bacterium]
MRIIFSLLAILLLGASCNRKKAAVMETPAPAEVTQVQQESAEPVSIMNPTGGSKTPEADLPVVEPVLESAPPQPPAPYVQVSLRKTACYGKCPVYELKIYSNGKATYTGKANVERLGNYEAIFTAEKMLALEARAAAINYFELSENYPPSKIGIPDLPNTISYVKIGEREKQIFNNHDAPAVLLDFEQFVENLVETLTWKQVEQK